MSQCDLEDIFSFRPPQNDQDLRETVKNLAEQIREQALAIKNLEQALFWATVARNE